MNVVYWHECSIAAAKEAIEKAYCPQSGVATATEAAQKDVTAIDYAALITGLRPDELLQVRHDDLAENKPFNLDESFDDMLIELNDDELGEDQFLECVGLSDYEIREKCGHVTIVSVVKHFHLLEDLRCCYCSKFDDCVNHHYTPAIVPGPGILIEILRLRSIMAQLEREC